MFAQELAGRRGRIKQTDLVDAYNAAYDARIYPGVLTAIENGDIGIDEVTYDRFLETIKAIRAPQDSNPQEAALA